MNGPSFFEWPSSETQRPPMPDARGANGAAPDRRRAHKRGHAATPRGGDNKRRPAAAKQGTSRQARSGGGARYERIEGTEPIRAGAQPAYTKHCIRFRIDSLPGGWQGTQPAARQAAGRVLIPLTVTECKAKPGRWQGTQPAARRTVFQVGLISIYAP